MMINWKELSAGGRAVTLRETLNVAPLLEQRPDVHQAGPLEANLRAHSISGAVVVEGTLSLEIAFVCSRCLGIVVRELTIPFREVFARDPEAVPGEDPDEVRNVQETRIDLRPYVEEAVLLAMPLVPLCSDECKGLCPVCGGNRNETDCGCRTEKVDPRLSALADFFKKEP